jgi:hypothetical protein
MPLDAAIPLSFQPTQKIEDPAKVQLSQVELQNAKQRNVLGQQQIQAVDLENQQRQRNMDAEKALSDLVSQNSTVGNDGVPHVNRGAVVKGMAERGHSERAMKWEADQRANEAAAIKNAKDQVANVKEQMEVAGQLLGPIVNAPADTPPDQIQAMYKDAHARAIKSGLVKPGDEPEELPVGADGKPDLTGVRAHYQTALNASQQAEVHQKQLDYALKLQEAAPKTAKEWQEVATGMASTAQNQQQLDGIRSYLKNHGAPDDVLSQVPQTWSAETQNYLGTAALSPEQRIKAPEQQAKNEDAQRANVATQLNAAKTYGDYTAIRNGIQDPKLKAQFPDFSQQDQAAELADEDRTQARRLGMSPAQAESADIRGQQVDLLGRRVDVMEKNANGKGKAGSGSPAAKKYDREQEIEKLAQRAMNDSRSGGGSSYDDAIRNVQQFYGSEPEMFNNRDAVIAQLNKWKASGLAPERTEAQIQKSQPVFSVGDDGKLRVNKPGAGGTGGRGGARPAAPAPSSAPAQRPAAPAPSTPTAKADGGQIGVKDPSGKVHTFPDEPSAKRFEDLVKNAGGTTQRVTQ